jgi:hypothetical protein
MLLHNKSSRYFLLSEILACYSILVVANYEPKLGEIQSWWRRKTT